MGPFFPGATVGSDSIATFVDSWTVAWTITLLAGYLADLTPWPSLKVLRSTRVATLMVMASAAAVLGLTLAGATEASAVLAAWAIVTSSVKLLYDGFARE
jgi:hypothetical protein